MAPSVFLSFAIEDKPLVELFTGSGAQRPFSPHLPGLLDLGLVPVVKSDRLMAIYTAQTPGRAGNASTGAAE